MWWDGHARAEVAGDALPTSGDLPARQSQARPDKTAAVAGKACCGLVRGRTALEEEFQLILDVVGGFAPVAAPEGRLQIVGGCDRAHIGFRVLDSRDRLTR